MTHEQEVVMWDRDEPEQIACHFGAWKTDAKKRTAMVEECRKRYGRDEPIYAVWLDGDEILCNGEYLRDELLAYMADDEMRQHEEGWTPLIAWPMLLVERDGGGVVVCRGKCVRIDLIDRYSVSSNVFVNHLGLTESHHGNLPVRMSHIELAFAEQLHAHVSDPRQREEIADQLREVPPLPCQPFLLHRSSLRHPFRRGLRLHEQEGEELKRAGLDSVAP